MICIVNQHFRINRILLLATGLWPYQQSLLVRFQQILFIGILASFAVFQLTVFLTSECTLNLVINILSSVLLLTLFLIKYNSFLINSQTIRNLLEQLQSICNELKDKNEIIIMKKYGDNAKRYTARIIDILNSIFNGGAYSSKICSETFCAIFFKYIQQKSGQRTNKYKKMYQSTINIKKIFQTIFRISYELIVNRKFQKLRFMCLFKYNLVVSTCSIFTVCFVPLCSRILDIVLPMNESQSRSTIQLITEYFVDQEKYFYLIFLHMNAAVCIGATTYIGTGTLLIAYLKHVCGMFTIVSYRIEQAMTINNLQNSLKNEILIYKGIIYAVDVHRKAIDFSKSLISSFEGSFFFLIGFSVVCLSFNLFAIYQTVLFGDKEEFLIHFTIVIVVLLYMFLANYAGQEIIDHNNHIFYTAYNVRWYVAPLHIQKLILFLLQRGSKIVSLNVGGLFVASLNCFASLASASVSYFTFIYSTQQ